MTKKVEVKEKTAAEELDRLKKEAAKKVVIVEHPNGGASFKGILPPGMGI